MTSQKTQTPQEIEEAKERIRKIALKNLKAGNLMNLASAFLVNESGQYGEAGDSAVEEFKYFPSFNSNLKAQNLESEKEYNIFENAIRNSRQSNKRYSGNISEYGIMQDCAEIMQNSLNQIKISDLYSELMGGSKKVKGELKDVYLGELRPQISQEEFIKLPEKSENIFQRNARTVGRAESICQRKRILRKFGIKIRQKEKNKSPEKKDG